MARDVLARVPNRSATALRGLLEQGTVPDNLQPHEVSRLLAALATRVHQVSRTDARALKAQIAELKKATSTIPPPPPNDGLGAHPE